MSLADFKFKYEEWIKQNNAFIDLMQKDKGHYMNAVRVITKTKNESIEKEIWVTNEYISIKHLANKFDFEFDFIKDLRSVFQFEFK